jgi:hypothetical protein
VRLAAQERPGGDHQEIREAGRRLLAELSAASGAGEAGRG